MIPSQGGRRCNLQPLHPDQRQGLQYPAAFFDLEVTNTTAEPLTYTFAGVLGNPLPANHLHTVEETPWGHALHLRSDSVGPHELRYGDMTLATDAGLEDDVQVSWQQFWFKGAWFDNLEVYWHDLNTPGPFKNRTYPPEQAATRNEGLLAVHVPVAPGATRHVRFVITWNFPNCENYWKAGAEGTWRNYYATVWPDSFSSARVRWRWPRLYAQARRFQDALFASSLPDGVGCRFRQHLDPQIATVLRLEDGTFYGWEGCHPTAGCCEGSCTHVWNYQQALPFLFPNLERSMRDADYAYNLRPDGGMPFRLQLPIGSAPWEFRPCADGQFGGILKLYRDWKISGDSEWLRNLWSAAKKSLEFAWSPRNIDRWDPDKTGVLWGRQHHTLDMELFGPNSWLTGMYLAALKAGAEIAEHLGETESAAEYRQIFARGKAWADENLFNGEYYYQDIDLGDKNIVDAYADDLVIQGGTNAEGLLDRGAGRRNHRIGAGSSIDQVLGQRQPLRPGRNLRLEKGRRWPTAIFRVQLQAADAQCLPQPGPHLLPERRRRPGHRLARGERQPVIPTLFAGDDERIQYSAATHMIMNGLVQEGMTCVCGGA